VRYLNKGAKIAAAQLLELDVAGIFVFG